MLMCLSPSVWRDVGRSWGGICFFYMLLLLALTWLPWFIKARITYNRFVATDAQSLVSQVPQITITNGVVSCDKPQPYTITEPKTGQPIVVIDTTGATTQPPPTPPAFLLTNNALITREQNNQSRTYDLSGIKSFYLDSSIVQGWLTKFGGWIFPVGYPLVLLWSILWRLGYMLVLGAIGMAFNGRAKLTYAGVMRLAAIAMTPMLVIDTALSFTPMPSLGCVWFFVEAGVTIAILSMAVKANAPEAAAGGGFAMNPMYAPPAPLPPPPPQGPWQQ